MINIYHNPRCRKSRAGLEYLLNINPGARIIYYLKDEPFTVQTLSSLIEKLDLSPVELVRTQEDFYKTELKGKPFSNQEWMEILVKNPQLIRRPIIETDHTAIIGEPTEEIRKIL